MIRESIEGVLDMDRFQEEAREEVDRDSITDLQGQVEEFVRDRFSASSDLPFLADWLVGGFFNPFSVFLSEKSTQADHFP